MFIQYLYNLYNIYMCLVAVLIAASEVSGGRDSRVILLSNLDFHSLIELISNNIHL